MLNNFQAEKLKLYFIIESICQMQETKLLKDVQEVLANIFIKAYLHQSNKFQSLAKL